MPTSNSSQWTNGLAQSPKTRRKATRGKLQRNLTLRRRLAVESLEQRSMLSVGATSAAQPQTLTDLPVAAQQSVSSAIGQDQSVSVAASAASPQYTSGSRLITFPTWAQGGAINGTATTWNQYCPLDPVGGNRCLTGCVATAVAQVLYYWHFPQSLSFSYEDAYTSDENGPINIPGGSQTYDFPNFSTLNQDLASITYDGDANEEALLSFAAGVKAQTDYGSNGSAASLLLPTIWGLGFSACGYSGGLVPDGLIASSIGANEPVLASISGSPGSHAVVIDGYNANNDTFHIDFGWGPSDDNDNGANDWFSLAAPINTSRGTFTSVDSIIYDMAPLPPTVSDVSTTTASGTYGVGTMIPITVTFSEPVTVSTAGGTPQLALNNGGVAVYAGGSGSTMLTFDYTVAPGQAISDLDYSSTAAIVLNGGSIQNTVSGAAGLTLPQAGNYLDGLANEGIAIATLSPTVTGISPTAGPAAGGTTVNIAGTGFTGATAVDFGTTAASSFAVNSDTSITATSPVGTGQVYVTVTNAAGTSTGSSAANQFTYVVVPSFALTGPTSGTFTAGQTVTIQWTAANVDAGSSISLAYDTTTNWGNPKWIEIGAVTAANGSASYSWNTTGIAAGTYYLGGYLWDANQPYYSHLVSAITITARPAPELYAYRPHLGNVYRGADGHDPMDGRQRRCGEQHQPGLRHDHQLGQPEVDRDRRGHGGQWLGIV